MLQIYKNLDDKAKSAFVQKYHRAHLNKKKGAEKDLRWARTFLEEVASAKSELHQGKDKLFLRLTCFVVVV